MNKKLTFLTVLLAALCLTVSVNAQGRIDLGRTSGNGVELQSSDFNGFNSTFSFNSIESDLISNEKGQFSEIFIDGSFPNGEVGAPQLPMITRLIAIPDGATPVVTLGSYFETEYRLSDYGIGKLSAMQAPVRKNVDPNTVEYAMNEAAYARNSYNDDPIAMVEVLGTMRGLTLGKLIVRPVRYNPVAGMVKVYNDIDVKVQFKNGDAASTAEMFSNTFSPAFNSVYDQIFNMNMFYENGSKDAYTDHPDKYHTPVKMLVICYSGFKNNSDLNAWLQWKLQKGYYVDIFYTDETGTTASAIASFIKTKYNASVSSGNAYTYLIVIGDTDQVTYYAREYESDIYDYCALDLGYSSVNYASNTSNYFPDMFYSRMSVQNATNLANYINKVLTYEKYQFSDGGNYLNNVILVGGWDSYWTSKIAKPTINYATNNYFNSTNNTYGGFSGGTIKATISTSSTAGYSGSNNGCYQGINNGACFVNYTAHGDRQEWYQPKMTATHVSQLTNTGKYFFGVGNCCLTGNFNNTSTDYSPGSTIGTNACFAEAMIRVPNAGAVAYIGCSEESLWYEDFYWAVGAHSYSQGNAPTVSNSTMGAYDAMFNDQYWNSAAAILYVGNLAVQQAINNNNTNSGTSYGAKYYFKFYHTFGDASIMPFVTKPEANNVTIPSTIASGATTMTVNAVAGSYVAVTNNTNTIYGVGVTNNSGVANVSLSGVPNSGTLYVVVTRQQYQPYFGTVTITSGTASEYTINVSASPTNGGTVSGGGTFSSGTTRTVTATANTGYTFNNWTENGSVVSTSASYSFTLNYNRNLVANFAVKSYTVNAAANPAEGGSVALAQGGKSNRATLTYDFESGTQGWTTLKGNTGNSPNNWMHSSSYPTSNNDFSSGYGHNESDGFMLSESYISGSSNGSGTAVTPDNYLVSPQVTLGGSISFYAGARNTDYCAEKFSVMVSTTNNTSTASFTTVQTFTLSLSEAGYTSSPYTVDLSAYSGMGYIAIRHFDCNDQWFIQIDDVTIVEGEYVDPSTATGTFTHGQTCVATATPNTGYHFVNWTENGSTVSSNATYSFTVTANRNLVANFSQQQTQTYTVTLNTTGTGGTITPSGTQVVNDGGNLTFTVTPNACYVIASVTVNGTPVTLNANNSYTITNIHANQTVNVTFNYDSSCGDCNVHNDIYETACDSYTWNGQTYTQSGNYTQTFPIGGDDPGTCDDNNPINNGFEGSLNGWTTIDADGDGYNWGLASNLMAGYTIPSYSGEDCICSESYHKEGTSGGTALTPDNYLISPKTLITGVQHTLSFWACAQDANWAAEHFGVAVSTTNNTNTNAFTMVQEWTMTAKGTSHNRRGLTRNGTREQGAWYHYTVDLSNYIGQEIYVAFRHFNCTDMFYIDIDQVELLCTTKNEPTRDCDSIVTLHLTINPSYSNISTNMSICPNETYTWQGHTFNGAGSHTATLTSVAGCDSVVTMTVNVYPSEDQEVTISSCTPYTWHGTTYSASGDYTYNGTSTNGCAVHDVLHLTISSIITNDIYVNACESYTWADGDGHTYTESGVHEMSYATATCDSTVVLHLTISNQAPVITITANTVSGVTTMTASGAESYVWSSGETTPVISVAPAQTTTYTVTGTDAFGCEGTATYTVVVEGIGETDNTVSIFPNPTENVINVKANNIERVRLFDITGQLILDSAENGEMVTIDMNGFAMGQYLLQVRTKDNVVTQKIIKR